MTPQIESFQKLNKTKQNRFLSAVNLKLIKGKTIFQSWISSVENIVSLMSWVIVLSKGSFTYDFFQEKIPQSLRGCCQMAEHKARNAL